MKKYGKQLIAMLICLVMICGCLACKADAPAAPAVESEPKPAAQESPVEPAAQPTQEEFLVYDVEPCEITVWYSGSGTKKTAYETVMQNFQDTVGKEYGITLNAVYQTEDTVSKTVMAYQEGDLANIPDVGGGTLSDIPTLEKLDITVPLDQYVNAPDARISKDDIYPITLRGVTYKDKMYAMPIYTSTLMLYYNVDALAAAGYTEPPKTWDELAEYVAALTQRDASGAVTRYGLELQTQRYQLVNFLVSQSPDSFIGDFEGGRTAPMTRTTIGEDGTLKKFLEKLQKVNETGGYLYRESNINEEFATGYTAMCIMSSSRINTVKTLIDGKFEFMTAYIPKVNESDSSGAAVGGSCQMLFNRGDENVMKAAYIFMEYCSSIEAQYILATETGYLPVTMAAEEGPDMQAFYKENPQFQTAIDQLKDSHANAQEPFDLVTWTINPIISDTIISFCEGNLTIDETIDEIVTQYDTALNEYHRAND